MKRHFMIAAVALGVAGTVSATAFANDRDREERRGDREDRRSGRAVVDQALEALYPASAGHEHYVKDPRDINGVQVYDVDVKAPGGTTFAQVTEFGDFLVSGAPVDSAQAPPRVREVVEGLFRDVPNVDAFVATYYYVYARAGDQDYELRFDAAGRIMDIRTLSDVHSEMPKEPKKAPESEHERLTKAAQQRFGDVEITGLNEWWEAPGFYVVNVRRDQDEGFVIVGPEGHIYSQRMDIDENNLPEPVVRTVEEVFRADIRNAQKGEQQYWQFRQPVGDDTLTLRVRPSGDIMDISRDQPTSEDERLAAERVRADGASGGDRQDDRDRDREDRRERRERRRDERERDRE